MVSAYVSQYRDQFVTVCCRNAASERLGLGRTFHGGFPEALAGYKSPEMKAIIRAAQDLFESATNLIPFPTA